MKLAKIAAGAALLAGLGFTTSVMAAQATAAVNVRSGPSTGYGVVDVLYRGEQVDVRECRSNGWCYVVHSGPDGWVSGNYLSGDGRVGGGVSIDVRPNLGFSFSFGRGNGFSIGGPRRGGDRDLVCLVTFNSRGAVEAGRDADVVRARVMSRAEAERRDTPRDRQGIFDYGTNQETRETCRYLDRLN